MALKHSEYGGDNKCAPASTHHVLYMSCEFPPANAENDGTLLFVAGGCGRGSPEGGSRGSWAAAATAAAAPVVVVLSGRAETGGGEREDAEDEEEDEEEDEDADEEDDNVDLDEAADLTMGWVPAALRPSATSRCGTAAAAAIRAAAADDDTGGGAAAPAAAAPPAPAAAGAGTGGGGGRLAIVLNRSRVATTFS
jgi:hypothetical protein